MVGFVVYLCLSFPLPMSMPLGALCSLALVEMMPLWLTTVPLICVLWLTM